MATMKAWQLSAFGKDGDVADAIANNLKLVDVAVPAPGPGQVQIKVEMASINPIDWKLFTGGMQAITPVTFPYTVGFDAAGSVSAVGEGVDAFAPGDRVCIDLGLVESCSEGTDFGPGGAFAQFCVAPIGLVAPIGDLPFEEVAGLPLAGLTTYQALFTGAGADFAGEELGRVGKGSKLMVLGGASSAGQFAIQLAKDAGAYVATTASPNKMPDGSTKIDAMKALGADEVINYKDADWSDALAGQDFDLVYDCVGDADDWPKSAKVLKKGGKFVTIANFGENEPRDDHKLQNFLIKSDAGDLKVLLDKVKAGVLKVPIDSVTPMEDVREALSKSAGWKAAGKQLIKISH